MESGLKCSYISSKVATCDWGKLPNSVVISESLIEASRGPRGSIDVDMVGIHRMWKHMSFTPILQTSYYSYCNPKPNLKYIRDRPKP